MQESEHETWERIDDSLVYHHFEGVQADRILFHSNIIRKYYEDAERAVIVLVSVSKYSLVNEQTRDTFDDTCGWLVFQKNPNDSEKCHLTILGHSNIASLVERQEYNNAAIED
ncbi:hypothetical protein AC1031_002150 [Aphanomyces cochlioides]|nr:hypothetical protein AC1031_002150 [Aphanomyces cochlioides]